MERREKEEKKIKSNPVLVGREDLSGR